MLLTATNCIKSLEEKIQDQEIQIKNLRTELEKLNANKEIEAKDTEIQNNFTQCKKQSFLLIIFTLVNLLKSATFPNTRINTKTNTNEKNKKKNITTLYKIVITSALCAVAFAADLPAYKLSAPYHPTPVYKEKEISPQLLGYEYDVTENNFRKIEIQDDNKVAGSFNTKQVKSPITSTTRASTTATTTRNNISIQQKHLVNTGPRAAVKKSYR